MHPKHWREKNRKTLKYAVLGAILYLNATTPTLASSPDNESPLSTYAKVPDTLLLDIAARQNTLLAVGQRGHILRSEDAGKHFELINNPSAFTLTNVDFLSDSVAIAAGHRLTLLRSQDGGKNWESVTLEHQDSAPWLDLLRLDKQNVIAVGAYGHYAHSKDQGQSWDVSFPTEEDFHLNAVAQTAPNQLVIAGEAGRVYVSNDLGDNWEGFSAPYDGSFFAVQKISPHRALLLGLRGTALLGDFSSTHPSWQFIEIATEQSWFGVSAAQSTSSVWMAGAAGQIAYLDLSDIQKNNFSETPPTLPTATALIDSAQFFNRLSRAVIANVLHHQNTLWSVGENGLKHYKIHANATENPKASTLQNIEYIFHEPLMKTVTPAK